MKERGNSQLEKSTLSQGRNYFFSAVTVYLLYAAIVSFRDHSSFLLNVYTNGISFLLAAALTEVTPLGIWLFSTVVFALFLSHLKGYWVSKITPSFLFKTLLSGIAGIALAYVLYFAFSAAVMLFYPN